MKHSSIEDDPHDDSIETEIPKMYLKVQSLIEFDTFVITHGPFTNVDSGEYIHMFYLIFSTYISFIYLYSQLPFFNFKKIHIFKWIDSQLLTIL